jgi:hypothetical protein
MSDVPSTPLWLHVGRRNIRHKVEALSSVLCLGTRDGRQPMVQPATALMPEEGVVWSAYIFRSLPDTLTAETSTLQHIRKAKEPI